MPKLVSSNTAQERAPTTPPQPALNRREFLATIPAFIRYPKPPQRDPVCGLSRTQLHSLVKAGRVRSVSLKQPGRGRGVRLIDVQSLIEAIESGAA
jgi:hypothetical protein